MTGTGTPYAVAHERALSSHRLHENPTAPLETSTASDAQLLRDIEETLHASGYLYLRRLTVTVSGGTVLLQGKVPTYYLKQLAQAAALATEGVEEVTNEIEVICPNLPPAYSRSSA